MAIVRVFASVLIVGWTTPILTVGIAGFGLPVPLAAVVAVAIAIGLAIRLRATVMAILDAFVTDQSLFRPALWLLLFGGAAIVAIVFTTRLAVFMADPARVEYSLIPSDTWRVEHNCLLAYTEGARFAAAGDRNIYDTGHYLQERIAGLRVDPYHYPPPFLLLPWVLGVVAPDFVALRSIWFMLQAIVLVIGLLTIGRWVGGRPGAWAVVTGSLMLAAPPVFRTLQMGNAQLTLVPLAMIGLVLAEGGRAIAGGSLLAYAALSKIFPGLLALTLLAGRRWRTVSAIAVVSLLLVGATIAVFGWRPFAEFLTYELPRLASGEAFPQTQNPRTIANNVSVYGLTARLHVLGVTWLEPRTGRAIASIYGFVVILLAALAGWRASRVPTTSEGRLARAQLWLALLSLASFRSPFVPADYGLIASLWLLTLLIAGASAPLRRAGWLLAFATLAGAVYYARSPLAGTPSTGEFVASALIVVCVLFLNLAIVARALARREEVPLSEVPVLASAHVRS